MHECMGYRMEPFSSTKKAISDLQTVALTSVAHKKRISGVLSHRHKFLPGRTRKVDDDGHDDDNNHGEELRSLGEGSDKSFRRLVSCPRMDADSQ